MKNSLCFAFCPGGSWKRNFASFSSVSTNSRWQKGRRSNFKFTGI